MKKLIIVLFLMSILFYNSAPIFADEQRKFEPIASSQQQETNTQLLFTKEEITVVLENMVSSWNTSDFEKYLSSSFYNKERLLSSFNNLVPKDAKLRLLAVQNIKILEKNKTQPKENPITLSIVIQTSLEYEDPVNGFQKLIGTNELILEVSGK